MMHIYAFGSICRGDISFESDIDLLALVNGRDLRLNPDKFSIYSYERISELWRAGNAFAWHLALESKLIYAEDGYDFIHDLGMPSKYENAADDCSRFREIFEVAFLSVKKGTPSLVFELSTIFLSIRNIATCFSLAKLSNPVFGRDSACELGSRSIPLTEATYSTLVRARLLSIRGMGDDIKKENISMIIDELENCKLWIYEICKEVG